jgi:DNA-binding response OmpR family regulator/cell division septation protein DedD
MPGNNILVVEDDGSAAKMIMDVLESEGYAVFSASTKAVAVELAGKTKPSLVYINAILADASGLEITRAIREIDELKEVPFIMLTEMQEEFNERYKSTYGIIGFLRKPVDANELLSKTASIVPLDGETVAGAPEVPASLEESTDDVWQTDEFEEADSGALASQSLDEDLSQVDVGETAERKETDSEDEDGRINIKVKVKGNEDFEKNLDETVEETAQTVDDVMIEQTAHEVPKGKEDLFSGIEEEQASDAQGDEETHPLDKGFVEQTAYESPESSGDMFEAAKDAVDSFEEEIGGEKVLEEQAEGFDIGSGPADDEIHMTDDSFSDNMPAESPDVSGDALDETLKEVKPVGKKAPVGAQQPDTVPKAKSKKIDDMDFDMGGLDAGSGAERFEDFAPVIKSGRSKTIKIIAFGLLGILIVAAATWFGLDYFGGNNKSTMQIKTVPTPQVQKKKEPVKEVVQPEATAQAEQQNVAPVDKPVEKPIVEKQVATNVEPTKNTATTAKKEVQKPAKPVKKKPAPVVKAKYSVQIGFFKEPANARSLYNKMKKKGYSVTVKKDRYKGSTVYRVLIGRYSSRDAAYRMIRKIKKIENMDAALHVL